MSKAVVDLKAAFAGESTGAPRTTYFAEKAEGRRQAPRQPGVLRAAAHAEVIHAEMTEALAAAEGHRREPGAAAIEGENYEGSIPCTQRFIQDAQAEGDKKALLGTFEWADQVEKSDAQMYSQMHKIWNSGAETDYYVCPVCGYTHAGPSDGRSARCADSAEKFEHFA